MVGFGRMKRTRDVFGGGGGQVAASGGVKGQVEASWP